MLDWLKTILGAAYTEEIDTKVSKEIGAGFVSKADFNSLNSEKKRLEGEVTTRDTQLADLQKSTGDVEALKTTIATLQADNVKAKATYDAELAQERLSNAVDKALTAAGAINNTAAKALLVDFLKDAKLAADGTVKGLAAELETMTKGENTSFLFQKPSGGDPQLQGFVPGNPGGNPPPAHKPLKDMSYEEIAAFMEQNPNAKI